jgi:hypothetical protein
MAESIRTDWRQLCAAAATETDSEKLADLVHRRRNLTTVARSNVAHHTTGPKQ